MRFGFHYMDFTLPGFPATTADDLRATARIADEGGASWLSVMDHYFQMEHYQTAHEPMLEAYTTLGFLAGVTEQIRLGVVVTGVTYRHPGLLAKIATTLDVLSKGRAFLGLGAAWYEREHVALGVEFPPLAERFERLEETIRIALQMWSDEEGPFSGAHYRLAETINVPPAIQRPHPPIVIGGSGEKKTLRLVAQYAQATNLIAPDVETVRHKLEVLRQHCDEVGRDYQEIEKTVQGYSIDALAERDEFLRVAEQFADLGVDHIQLRAAPPSPSAFVERFCAEVAPALSAIPVAGR